MFDFDVSDKHTVQQAVDADKAEGLLRAKRAGSPDGDVTSALLARMAEAGNGALSTQLAQLKKGDPGLYATAMTALQPLMGNQGVNQLHESVQRQGSGNAIIDFAQAKWAAESVQRRPEGHGEEGR